LNLELNCQSEPKGTSKYLDHNWRDLNGKDKGEEGDRQIEREKERERSKEKESKKSLATGPFTWRLISAYVFDPPWIAIVFFVERPKKGNFEIYSWRSFSSLLLKKKKSKRDRERTKKNGDPMRQGLFMIAYWLLSFEWIIKVGGVTPTMYKIRLYLLYTFIIHSLLDRCSILFANMKFQKKPWVNKNESNSNRNYSKGSITYENDKIGWVTQLDKIAIKWNWMMKVLIWI